MGMESFITAKFKVSQVEQVLFFTLIPAQNATGNWIKVVQRLPVRITLDPKELAEHPLRVGLSMQ